MAITPANYTGQYLGVFLSNKNSPKWQAWYALTEEEQRAKQAIGIPALLAWDEKHRDSIVYIGGPLGPTKRMSEEGMSDAVNEMTAVVAVRAPSHEAAVKMFEAHPHFTIFTCDCVEVMPLLGPAPGE